MNSKVEQSQSLKVRLFFAVFIVLLASSYLVINALYLSEPVAKVALDNANAKTLEREKSAQPFFQNAQKVVTTIRTSRFFNEFLENNNHQSNVLEEFKLIAKTNLDVFQVQYLDAQGKEVLRVSRDDKSGEVMVATASQLQDKSDRDYFTQSLTKPLEKVWFSAIDLDIDGDAIQQPIIPILRVVLPISEQGQFHGLIVIKYYASTFLKNLMRAPLYDSVLVNNLGEILVHHNAQKSWPHLLGLKVDLNDEFPELKQSIESVDFLQTETYFYRKFDLPLTNGLGMIMKLNSESLAKEKEQAFKHDMSLLVSVTVFSLILSQIFISILSRIRNQTAKLEEVSRRFKSLLELSADAIFIMSMDDGSLIEYSRTTQKALGYSDDEMKSLKITDWDKEMSLQEYQDIVNSMKDDTWQFERWHWRKDGTKFQVSIAARIIEIEGQRVVHATSRDISEHKQLKEDLLSEQNYNSTLVDSANAIIAEIALDGTMVKLNRFGQEFVGCSQEEVASAPFYWARFVNDKDRAKLQGAVMNAKNGELMSSYRNSWRHHSGQERMIEWSNSLILDDHQKIKGVFAIGIDVEESFQLSQKLMVANTIIDSAINGVLITDKENRIIDVNEAFSLMNGYTKEELIGQTPKFNQSGIHDNDFYQQMWSSLIKHGHWKGEVTNKRKDGSLYTCLMSITVIKDEQNAPLYYAAIYSDITDIQEAKDQLHFIANHDPLTHLPNRLMFHEILQNAIKKAQREGNKLAVVFFDLDRFKQINDSFGHHQGDAVLTKVAERLKGVSRATDLFARLGGDEFAMIVEDVKEPTNIGHLAQKILDIFDKPFILNEGLEVNIGTSIGVAIYPNDGVNSVELLSHSDSAMYKAKSLGGNQYQYYEAAMTDDVRHKLNIEGLLRQAVNKGELFLVYQPQIDVTTQTLIGCEALLRWNSPELGSVSPAEFIPVAEESGLIIKLTDYVLQEVALQIKQWLEKGISFKKVAINISMIQLESEGFPDYLSALLSQYDLNPSYIELEITEGVFLKYPDLVLLQLDKIRKLGFSLSMDDFGTGFSSLSYLKKLPIQKLKIDKSFVSDIPMDKDDVEITKAIIALGQSLDLTLIAEGAETIEQVEFLKKHGCNQVQGYFFSKPLEVEQFEHFAKNPIV